MGAPPPTTVKDFKVEVRITTTGIKTASAKASFWDEVEKILLCYGRNPKGKGNGDNGLKFEVIPPYIGAPPESYAVWFVGTDPQRGKFLGAYKALRAELSCLSRDSGAFVKEWEDVSYAGRSLAWWFPGILEPNEPEKPKRDNVTDDPCKKDESRRKSTPRKTKGGKKGTKIVRGRRRGAE